MLTDAMRETLQATLWAASASSGKNITDPEQLAQFNADLQAASRTPLFIAVDEEGGAVARLANTGPLTCRNMRAPPRWARPATRRTPAPWGRPSAHI